jgi:hypothetical protein
MCVCVQSESPLEATAEYSSSNRPPAARNTFVCVLVCVCVRVCVCVCARVYRHVRQYIRVELSQRDGGEAHGGGARRVLEGWTAKE